MVIIFILLYMHQKRHVSYLKSKATIMFFSLSSSIENFFLLMHKDPIKG